MTNAGKAKAEKAAKAEAGLEPVFDALERRIERLSETLKALSNDNARLKGELAAARKAAASQGEDSQKLSRYEAERAAVRTRIERLIKGLEGLEEPSAGSSS